MDCPETTTLLELFQLTRLHAKETKDPSYKRIGAPKGKPASFNNGSAKHFTPKAVQVELPRLGERVIPEGTQLVLYQDIVNKQLKPGVSVGTLFLEDLQVTLRGDLSIRGVNPAANHILVGYRPGRLRTDD